MLAEQGVCRLLFQPLHFIDEETAAQIGDLRLAKSHKIIVS